MWPLENLWLQWLEGKKPLGKPWIPMVEMWKTIDSNGSLVKKNIEKPSTPMVLWQKPLTTPSCPKINHRYGLLPYQRLWATNWWVGSSDGMMMKMLTSRWGRWRGEAKLTTNMIVRYGCQMRPRPSFSHHHPWEKNQKQVLQLASFILGKIILTTTGFYKTKLDRTGYPLC